MADSNRFEAVGRGDPSPDPTAFFGENRSDAFDRLAQEFAERCRRGESPSIDRIAEGNPDHAESIRKLFPTIATMEQLNRDLKRDRPSGIGPGASEWLGEYRVLRELGRGGMGVVYEADQEALGRRVAVKVLHQAHPNQRLLLRFRREAEAVARLHHTNIIPIFGVGDHEGRPFYAMQLIEGPGLDVVLSDWRGGACPPSEDRWRFVARVGVQAAGALHYAHEQGVLHRDIKPANILIDADETVWIADFGLAKFAGSEVLTESGDIVGTLRYIAPEGLRGVADARSDVYSLGLTLYELLVMEPPFGEHGPSELLRLINQGPLSRPRGFDASIPRDLETIIMKASARDADARYATAAALADDLGRFLDDRPIAARPAGPIERTWRWARRNRAVATLAALAVGSLLFAAALGWIGYASTARALAHAHENERLSLEIFDALFDDLGGSREILPPPAGRGLGVGVTEHRPGRPPGPSRKDGPPPFDGRDGPPPRDGRDGRDGPGPPHDDTDRLRSVMTFYERFARMNEANPRLQAEAAWAYRRVGAYYDRRDQEAEADDAFERAIAMLEDLVDRFPSQAESRYRLAETYLMADPWTVAEGRLGTLARRLERAVAIADRLRVEKPDDLRYLQLAVLSRIKHGAALQRSGDPSRAAPRYREAIALGVRLVREATDRWRALMDRADAREALAWLLIEAGRPEEARPLLDRAAEDLDALEPEERSRAPAIDRLRILAGDYRRLGDAARADELDRAADDAPDDPPRPRPGPGPRDDRSADRR